MIVILNKLKCIFYKINYNSIPLSADTRNELLYCNNSITLEHSLLLRGIIVANKSSKSIKENRLKVLTCHKINKIIKIYALDMLMSSHKLFSLACLR